ncbi:hydroxyacid dehydrogenase [Cerasicoccus arenae]|uniref:2-hydroxyacid dehydrogenase n=1 Tax=Cerasicoccus arenae TaxID=424488 RepID=A0A8J3GC76_9BACT|nr:hydroxyacid dehydrogenase [Cerasicoccus arenae]MBK1859626.1 hydroxyacid dehydrogenase [Cerasicoccus arenae]GHB96343.1 2-hydroxyacid dehydrogenase [Cerasicoccus arenae]
MNKAIITGMNHRIDVVYGPKECGMLEERLSVTKLPQSDVLNDPSILAEANYIFGTWGMPMMDEGFMRAMPNLKAVFYAAGSVKAFTSDAFWESGVRLFSAWGANAFPVAEYTFAQIILCLKRAWPTIRQVWKEQSFARQQYISDRVPGAYGSTVGLLSLGQIGRLVVDRLRTLDVEIIAYDPFVSQEDAHEMGVKICSLEEVFSRADVVTCHTPWLPQTVKMLRREHFASMKPSASFINTARGAVVDEEGLISVLTERPDITAILDVTYPEPPKNGSPFYTLPNVVLTPHIAGSIGDECRRMAQFMIAEYDRMIDDQPTRWEINRERAATLA